MLVANSKGLRYPTLAGMDNLYLGLKLADKGGAKVLRAIAPAIIQPVDSFPRFNSQLSLRMSICASKLQTEVTTINHDMLLGFGRHIPLPFHYLYRTRSYEYKPVTLLHRI